MSYTTPDGASIANLRGNIQAVGVALLFTYSINFICQGLITFVLKKEQNEKKKVLTKLLETSRVLYYFAIAVIFSIYPPFYQGTHSAVLAWLTFITCILLHITCFIEKKIKDRTLWSYFFFLYHFFITLWILIAMGYAYNWSSEQ